MSVGDLVREKGLHDGWDEEYQSFILNEDKVTCSLQPTAACFSLASPG